MWKHLPPEGAAAVERLQTADIVVGIPSYNNARTIPHVVRAAEVGLAKYFPSAASVIVNSDGGSRDGTREAVLSATLDERHLLLMDTPMPPVHRLSLPYHGIPGKGSAFRMIFSMAERLRAKACAVVDADLRSMTPEWIGLLLRPVLEAGYDFVAPYYHRHKYDGTITNHIVYPLTRSLYGLRVRQPIGGDFGVSLPLIMRYLSRHDWETDVARYGIDIWMTTIALAEGYRVSQSFLGAKLHDAKDPGADLSAMLHQVIGSVFALMAEYEPVWAERQGSSLVELFGFRYDVGVEPVDVDLARMLAAFARGCLELKEIWQLALRHETFYPVLELGRDLESNTRRQFYLPDELWFRIIADFACAYRAHPLERAHILASLTPLYLARVASFVIEAESLTAAGVEHRIEELCRVFEQHKSYLVTAWKHGAPSEAATSPVGTAT